MTTFRERFQFFLEHAGYSTPPGRTVCAFILAQIEEELANDNNFRVTWYPDDVPYDDIRGDAEREGYHPAELLCAVLEKRSERGGETIWEPVSSLGGIADPSPECRRVIEAEVASESF